MEIKNLINERVHNYYWEYDLNCATTMLKILAEIYNVKISSQVLDAAVGMHGAGFFGAQCGLVEGSLMFIGIFGKEKELEEKTVVDICYNFADEFQKRFGSLLCRKLRPEGFRPDNPPHLCENLTKEAVKFTMNFVELEIKNN
jgi:C_GCAxxG_C_C family probable redox protein